MSTNIRSLNLRLKRLERKSGAGSAKEFYDKLSDDELWAIMGLPLDVGEDREGQVDYYSQTLSISAKKAEELLLGLDQVFHSLAREFRHLSDEDLIELIQEPMFEEPLSDDE
jgi:hypothetical protein